MRKKKRRIWTDRKERRDELGECEEEDEETTAEGVTNVQNQKIKIKITFTHEKHNICKNKT